MNYFLAQITDMTGTVLESIVRESDGAFIPIDESNVDYQAYLAWVEEGNTPEPWEPK